jgi:uncharacterized protein YndB with AHSA1/START domain
MTTDTSALTVAAEPGSALIVVEREVRAPRALVFRAFTEPDLLVQWLGPRRLTMRVEHYDVRHGGSYRYVHVDTDGSEYVFQGTFHGEPTPDRIVQTFEFLGHPGHVSLDTLDLVDRGERTLIRMTSAFQSIEDRDGMLASGMTGGIEEGFERLEELAARLRSQA